ncbi:MAG: hypothetical protein N2109_01090 [Fimbriimonadales bacterium]|nr:hypothetical protein [Fimbriimonadales bacterium]
MIRRACLMLLAAATVGCSAGTGVTEADAQKMKEEFSTENYEKAMREAGKADELEAQKQREAQYLQGTGQQDAEQR